MLNNTDVTYYVSPTGQVHEGDDPPPPDGSTLLVAPGSQIQDDKARKYGIYDKLAKGGESKVARSTTGEPLVTRDDGRAMAANVLPDDDDRKQATLKAAEEEDDAADEDDGDESETDAADEDDESGVKVKRPDVQGKALRLGDPSVEDKSVSGPPQAKRGPGRPRGK